MNKEQKNEVIETLKEKFSQYSNFYITDTKSLSVAQITNLRRHCFDKQVEMKVAKNTLIKKALESLDSEKYLGVYDSLHQVTALMFSESPKEPALIISSFRRQLNAERPVLKAAFLNGDIFVGDNQLVALTKIKTKNELIGEVIGLLMSPIQRVIGALQNRSETSASGEETKVENIEAKADVKQPAVKEVKSEVKEQPVVEAESKPEIDAKAAESKPETEVKKEAEAPVAIKDESAPGTGVKNETETPTVEGEESKPEA